MVFIEIILIVFVCVICLHYSANELRFWGTKFSLIPRVPLEALIKIWGCHHHLNYVPVPAIVSG